MQKVLIAPSTDPVADIKELIKYVKSLNGLADLIHCDVMDGKFVEKKSIDDQIVKSLFFNTTLPLDIHLMMEKPQKQVQKYIDAGAQIVTVHFEAFKNLKQLTKCLKYIKKQNRLAGVSINPSTDIEAITDILNIADVVLIMSVVPGKSGQMFMGESLIKIQKLNEIRKEYNLVFKIEVDGGINNTNCEFVRLAGADILVSGSYVFKAEDREQAINLLKDNNI